MNVLIVEDSEKKLDDIKELVLELGVLEENITIAKNFVEGRAKLKDPKVDLAVIDISLDIAPRETDTSRENFANTGGFQLIELIMLNEIAVRIIIVTGFSTFFGEPVGGKARDIQSLESLIGQVEEWFQDDFLGCVKYADDNWQEQFKYYFPGG